MDCLTQRPFPFLNYVLNKVAPAVDVAVILVVIVVVDDYVAVADVAQSILQIMTSGMLYHRCFCRDLLYFNTFDKFSAFFSLLDLFKKLFSLSCFLYTNFTLSKISLNFISFQELQGC